MGGGAPFANERAVCFLVRKLRLLSPARSFVLSLADTPAFFMSDATSRAASPSEAPARATMSSAAGASFRPQPGWSRMRSPQSCTSGSGFLRAATRISSAPSSARRLKARLAISLTSFLGCFKAARTCSAAGPPIVTRTRIALACSPKTVYFWE